MVWNMYVEVRSLIVYTQPAHIPYSTSTKTPPERTNLEGGRRTSIDYPKIVKVHQPVNLIMAVNITALEIDCGEATLCALYTVASSTTSETLMTGRSSKELGQT